MLKIKKCYCKYHVQPLIHALGFKGGSLTELWQVICTIEADNGASAIGYGTQSVLWSDSSIFAKYGQVAGNKLMFAVTEYALGLLEGMTLLSPPDALKKILDDVIAYAKTITNSSNLRKTFVLNALTPVDWALWKLYKQDKKSTDFQTLMKPFTSYLTSRQTSLGNIPLVSYDTTMEEINELAKAGCALFKIKIGSNPSGRNDPNEMLSWDINRLREVHKLLSRYETPYTDCGRPLYYFDANGRYDTRERLMCFLEAADSIGALGKILLLEEPFPESAICSVQGMPVTIVGDESAHSAEDAVCLIENYGYSAIALKPIAKTLSISLDVLEEAGSRHVPCFCADLTVNPQMVEMNKLFAAHLSVLPGLKIGVFESNGNQNYLNWHDMVAKSGFAEKPWSQMNDGVFLLDEIYYKCDGGIW